MHRRLLTLFFALGLVLAMVGAVSASIPYSTTGKYVACMDRYGKIRLIDHQAGKRCSSSEKSLTWNQRGPAGPKGATGEAGAPGADGVSGYEVVSADSAFTVGEEFGTGAVDCPEGKVPVGGGYKFADVTQWGYGHFLDDYPTATGWAVDWYHGNQTIEMPFSVYAICVLAQ